MRQVVCSEGSLKALWNGNPHMCPQLLDLQLGVHRISLNFQQNSCGEDANTISPEGRIPGGGRSLAARA